MNEQDDEQFKAVVQAYVDDRINLGKAAELLGISQFELMDRFQQLGIPLRLGPETIEDALEEVRVAQKRISKHENSGD